MSQGFFSLIKGFHRVFNSCFFFRGLRRGFAGVLGSIQRCTPDGVELTIQRFRVLFEALRDLGFDQTVRKSYRGTTLQKLNGVAYSARVLEN